MDLESQNEPNLPLHIDDNIDNSEDTTSDSSSEESDDLVDSDYSGSHSGSCTYSSNDNVTDIEEDIFASRFPCIGLTTRPPQVLELSNVIVTLPGLPLQMRHRGFRLVGDNIDKAIRRRHLRLDRKNESIHYFHVYAVENRIDASQLPDTSTKISEITDIDSAAASVLPKVRDDLILKDNITVLISRFLYKYLDFFKLSFDGIIQWHITHKHSSEMSTKSVVVSNMPTDALTFCVLRFHLVLLHKMKLQMMVWWPSLHIYISMYLMSHTMRPYLLVMERRRQWRKPKCILSSLAVIS